MRLRFAALCCFSVLLALLPHRAGAQFVERAPLPKPVNAAGVSDGSQVELFRQMILDYWGGSARSRMKVVKLWINPIGDAKFPFYVFSNPVVLIPDSSDWRETAARELLNGAGGLVNLNIAKILEPRGSTLGEKGPQGELRLGAKYVQLPGVVPDSGGGVLVGQAGGIFSWYMPILGESMRGPGTRVGLIALNARPTALVTGGDVYHRYFIGEEGGEPSSLFGSLQLDASIHIGELFVTAGYTFSTSDAVTGTFSTGVAFSRLR